MSCRHRVIKLQATSLTFIWFLKLLEADGIRKTMATLTRDTAAETQQTNKRHEKRTEASSATMCCVKDVNIDSSDEWIHDNAAAAAATRLDDGKTTDRQTDQLGLLDVAELTLDSEDRRAINIVVMPGAFIGSASVHMAVDSDQRQMRSNSRQHICILDTAQHGFNVDHCQYDPL